MQRFLFAGLALAAIAAFASPGLAQQQDQPPPQENQTPAARSLHVVPNAQPAVHRVAPVARPSVPYAHVFEPAHAPHAIEGHDAHGAPLGHPDNLHTAHFDPYAGRADQIRHDEALRNERLREEHNAAIQREEHRQAEIRHENARIEHERELQAARIRDERWHEQHAANAATYNRYAPAPAPSASGDNHSAATSNDNSSSDSDADSADSNSSDADSANSSSTDSSDSSSSRAQDPKAAAISAILNLLDKH